jgi:hypothetical protein
MLWIGLIWFFGYVGWKLLKSGNIIAVFFGIILLLIAMGLSVFLIAVMFVKGL